MTGKNVTIVGRSMVVGRPLSMLMLKENATVTVCHTKTKDLKAVCREADILVAAAGKAKMLDASFLKEGAVLIDVGINVDETESSAARPLGRSGRKSLRGDPGPGRRRSCDDGCTGEASGDGVGEKGESVNFLNFSGKSINKGFFEQGPRRV